MKYDNIRSPQESLCSISCTLGLLCECGKVKPDSCQCKFVLPPLEYCGCAAVSDRRDRGYVYAQCSECVHWTSEWFISLTFPEKKWASDDQQTGTGGWGRKLAWDDHRSVPGSQGREQTQDWVGGQAPSGTGPESDNDPQRCLLLSLTTWVQSLEPTRWKGESAPTSCPLIFTWMLWHMCPSTSKINKRIYKYS